MAFIAFKTDDGKTTGKITFYCRMLHITRQGFYRYLKDKDKPWKYEPLVQEMKAILKEDNCNDTYGFIRMHQALEFRSPEGIDIPSPSTIRRIMIKEGITHKRKRKPNGLTKADKEAQKSDDLLQRDFSSDKPFAKCVTDITEVPAENGKLYVSGLFDCYDTSILGLTMDTNMKAPLCAKMVENACKAYPQLRGGVIHSDRGSQYTSKLYRNTIQKYGIVQSMNSAGGRCHDNAKCESMWARFKEELFYGRINTKEYTVEELKVMIWRYFMSYWNNRRICSAIGGIPPIVKRQRYYDSLAKTDAVA